MNKLDMPPCARCTHPYTNHYNTRPTYKNTGRKPCHKLGRHDMRCSCRDYVPASKPDDQRTKAS